MLTLIFFLLKNKEINVIIIANKKGEIIMKKMFLRGILLIMCFMLVGCENTKKEEEVPDIPSLDEREKLDVETINELNKVKVIKIYKPDNGTDEVQKWKIVKEVTDSVDIDSIISIVSDGRKIESGEHIVSIGSSFKLEMYDVDNNLVYNIFVYTPTTSGDFVEIKSKNEDDTVRGEKYYVKPIFDVIDTIVNK